MENILALKVKSQDNVATIFSEKATASTVVDIRDPQGEMTKIQVWDKSGIPYGHKIAVKAIKKGSPVIKYGEIIGCATTDIEKGDHVHIHNMDSLRGRGDLEAGH